MIARKLLLTFAAALLTICALAVPANAAPGALKVLIYQTCFPSYAADFEPLVAQLQGQAGVSQVVQAGDTVPTAAELAQYDGVVVSSYCTFDPGESVALGNALADYQDAGGVVIGADWIAWSESVEANYSLQGRWGTDYSPFLPDQTNPSFSDTVTVLPNSPFFFGVTKVETTESYPVSLAPGATAIATWNNGQPMLAQKGRAVALGFVPASTYVSADTNVGAIVANAIKYLGWQPLSITKAGNGTGTVTSTLPGLDCGALCSTIALPGTTATLTAKAAKNSVFVNWVGDGCSGTVAICPLTVTFPGNGVVATFASTKLKFGKLKGSTLSLSLPNAGKVTVSGSGLKKSTKTTKKAGKVTLKLKLKSSLKKKIAKNGKAKVKIKFAYTPTGAAKASSTSKSFTVK